MTFTPGNVLTASQLNAFSATNVTLAWSSHTPSWTGLDDTDGTTTISKMQIGDTVTYNGKFVFAAASGISGALKVDLPVNAATAAINSATGVALYFDNSATFRSVGAVFITAADVLEFAFTENGPGLVDGTSPYTWATSDSFRWSITYETV